MRYSLRSILFAVAAAAVVPAMAGAQGFTPPFVFGRDAFPVYRSVFENEIGSKNLLMMSDFEFDLGARPDGFPWRAESLDAEGKAKGPMPILMDDKVSSSGERSAKMVLPAGATVRLTGPDCPVRPGTYTFSIFLAGKGVQNATLGAVAVVAQADGTTVLQNLEMSPVPDMDQLAEDQFVRVQQKVTVPPNAVSARPVLVASGSGMLRFDAAQFEEGATPTPHWESPLEEMLVDLVNDYKPRSSAAVSNGSGLAIFAFDGRLDTAWSPASARLPMDIGLAFPESADIKGIRVIFGDATGRPAASGAAIEIKDVGEWKNVPVIVTDAGQVIDYEFTDSVTADELRYKITEMLPQADGAKAVSIREIYFWFDE